MTTVARESGRGASLGIPRDARAVAATAQLACVLEVNAPKPGNVSPGRPFADMRHEDFLASAAVIRGPLAGADTRPLGETIWMAVEATSRCTRANTNLGIVLLLAPLARAAIRQLDAQTPPGREERLRRLRVMLGDVLAETTVNDARDVYRAIRLANPGGLGSAADQDVADEPTVTLIEAMRLAAHRDGIAREYATTFEQTFDFGAPALRRARADGLAWSEAIVETFLTVLAERPDTHIARRGGEPLARRVSRLAAEALSAGGVRSDAGRRAAAAMDSTLRDPRNLANPGTTADVTAAAVFVALLTDGWQADQEGA